MVQRWEKIDDYTVAIYTNVPFSHFLYLVTRILYVSPTAWVAVIARSRSRPQTRKRSSIPKL
jgi:hypothetical protein